MTPDELVKWLEDHNGTIIFGRSENMSVDYRQFRIIAQHPKNGQPVSITFAYSGEWERGLYLSRAAEILEAELKEDKKDGDSIRNRG